MKTIKFFLVLLAFSVFLVTGCSDKQQSPISPADQVSLEKVTITNFTCTSSSIGYTGEGEVTLTPGGKWQLKKFGVIDQVVSADPFVQGTMQHYLSATIDAVTGEGPCHGNLILTPTDNTIGGVWRGNYEGYRSLSNIPGQWTIPLHMVMHGEGGTIDGMQGQISAILTIYTDGTTTLPSYWTAECEGFYKSH